jgi:hypothetical protein
MAPYLAPRVLVSAANECRQVSLTQVGPAEELEADGSAAMKPTDPDTATRPAQRLAPGALTVLPGPHHCSNTDGLGLRDSGSRLSETRKFFPGDTENNERNHGTIR